MPITLFANGSVHSSSNLPDFSESHSNPSLESFRKSLMADLPATIEQQRFQKSYRRDAFEEIIPVDSNPIKMVNNPPSNIHHYCAKTIFYPFNAEGVRDHGWGCAWRAIQTCLASSGISCSFEQLFHLFGKEDVLKFLYSNKYDGQILVNDKPFAPYDLLSGWAEPFIGQMAFHFFGMNAVLDSVNGVPDGCNAPKEVFHEQPLSFELFVRRLYDHFHCANPLPVMIDNGSYALCIIGIGIEGESTSLWVADPHIKPGAGNANDIDGICGVFTFSFNQAGQQVECSLDKINCDQTKYVSDKIRRRYSFDHMKWMALFPKGENQ